LTLSSAVPVSLSAYARIKPIRANIGGSLFSATGNSTSIAGCHSSASCFARQFSDVPGGIAQGAHPAIDHDRIKKLLIPGHELISLRGPTLRTTPRSCAKSRLRLRLWGATSLFLGQNTKHLDADFVFVRRPYKFDFFIASLKVINERQSFRCGRLFSRNISLVPHSKTDRIVHRSLLL
jgi:hypothetical protein